MSLDLQQVPPQAAVPVIHVKYKGRMYRAPRCENSSNVQQWVCEKFRLETAELEYEDDGTWVVFDSDVDKDGGLQARTKWLLQVLEKEPAAKKMRVEGGCEARPESTVSLDPPPKLELHEGTWLNTKSLCTFIDDPTEKLFLRHSMMELHAAAITALTGGTTTEFPRMVSLVGCPGIGKTWCALLVACTLQEKCIPILHLKVKPGMMTVIDRMTTKSVYYLQSISLSMLASIIMQSSCDVCILDISSSSGGPSLVADTFSLVQSFLETPQCPPQLRFLGLASGHVEEYIIGKSPTYLVKRLVMYNWSEEDMRCLLQNTDAATRSIILKVCGSTVQFAMPRWNMTTPWDADKKDIESLVKAMTDEQVDSFLAGDRPPSDTASKQYSRLAGYFKDKTQNDKEGAAGAQILPRSDFVLQCFQGRLRRTSPKHIKRVFQRLTQMNPGAAGTAFEMLVHKYWEEKILQKETVSLRLSDDGECEGLLCLDIDCASLAFHNHEMELWNDKTAGMPLGYFTSKNPMNRSFDSILRWKNLEGQVQVLAFQISIGQHHKHTPRNHNLLEDGEEKKGKKKEKCRLALWDFRVEGKACSWKPSASEFWKLCYIRCTDFNSWASGITL